MIVDTELSQFVESLHERSDAAGHAGRRNLEAAYMHCLLVLVEACYEDGVELDADLLSFQYGAIDG